MSIRARLAVAIGGLSGGLFVGFVALYMLAEHTPFWIAVLYVLGTYAAAAVLIAVVFAAINWAMKGGTDA